MKVRQDAGPNTPWRGLDKPDSCRLPDIFPGMADTGALMHGYTRRALVEASISRFKRGISTSLRSQTEPRRATEITIAVHVLNRMLELGRPKFVRVA
ncbi:hypothetical protein Mnod_5007 [Methylobacterium nodulans ORS 2060]|uniref:Transposase n=1 Tax=Methylobacterium nodulans (strain LMG 21967 / CNCM I-2342 / ORS 2060) TaxID=460265 RepID=B8III2_METNO|nr:hypothetical protein Mnod_5007 [Methylobacterium nodulans ORS 2060]